MPADPASVIPAGDMGLGLCYLCVKILALMKVSKDDKAQPFPPRFAITMAPFPVPELGGVPLALPCCFGCLTGTSQAAARLIGTTRLLIPRG